MSSYTPYPDRSPAFTRQIKPQVYKAWEIRDSDSEALLPDSDEEDADEDQRSSDTESVVVVEQRKARKEAEETPVQARKQVAKCGKSQDKLCATATDLDVPTGKQIQKRKRVESDSSDDEENGEYFILLITMVVNARKPDSPS